jgi:rubredoxin|tara:strand:- start:10108 stop:11265 length:1158 start_codon:yes stop_codon:yes gene_type:complete
MDQNYQHLTNSTGAGDKKEQKIEDFAEIKNRSKSGKEIHTFVTGLRNNNVPDKDIPKVLLGMEVSQEDINDYFNGNDTPEPNRVINQLESAPAPQVQQEKVMPKAPEPSVDNQAYNKAQQVAQQRTSHAIKGEEKGSIFKVPTAVVDLPSGGHFYGGKSSVEVKYLTASEDDILFSPELIRQNKAIDALLDAVVQGRDLRPTQMLTGDRNFLIMFVRRTGFGDEYDTGEMMCKSCGHVHSPVVDLSLLEMKPLDYLPDAEGWYSVKMPTTKVDLRFRLLTGEDENYLQQKIKSSSRKIGNFRVPAILTEKYLLQIMEVDGQKDKIYIKSFIDAMPMLDSNFLREYVAMVEPGIDLNYHFICPSCGFDDEKDIPIGPKLFYPNSDI